MIAVIKPEPIQRLSRSMMNSQPVWKSADTPSRWDKKPSSGMWSGCSVPHGASEYAELGSARSSLAGGVELIPVVDEDGWPAADKARLPPPVSEFVMKL